MATPLLPHQLPKKILWVWAIRDLLFFGIPLLALGLVPLFGPSFGLPSDLPEGLLLAQKILLGLFLALLILNLALNPLRYHFLRYDLRDTEIVFQAHVFFRKTTYVPIIRVQHVDVDQGPLLRAAGLSSVVIHTAATTHAFPGLDHKTAGSLRDQILTLVKEYQDGL